MQVFKCFFTIIGRNKGLMILYACIFVFLAVTLSNVAMQDTQLTFTDTALPVTVIDRDGTQTSRALRSYVYEKQREVPLPDDTERLQDALYAREVEYVLFIPAGYEQALLAGDAPVLDTAQVPNSYSATYVDRQVQRFVDTVRAYTASGFSVADALAHAQDDLARQTEVQLSHQEVQQVPAVYYYFNYLCYAFMMILIFGLSPVMLVFGKPSLAARMNASALPLRRKNLELALGATLLTLACFVLFVIIAFVLYGSQMLQPGALWCMLNALVFLVFSMALGLFIGMVSKTGNTISALANVVGLALCFLGGVYVPLDLMGSGMQAAAHFLPTYWYIRGVELASELGTNGTAGMFGGEGSSALSGGGIPAQLLVCLLIQLLFAVALGSVALVVSRHKQRAGV